MPNVIRRILVLLAICSIPHVASAQVKPLLENDRVHVHEGTIKIGFKTPEHTHPANEAIYVLSGGRVRVTLPDGTARVADLKTGEIMWRSIPETHVAENIGDTEIRLLTFRLKEPPAPSPKAP